MRRVLIRAVVLAALGLGGALARAAEPLPATVSTALRQANIPLDAVGVYLQSVDQAAPRLALHADKLFNPASAMKVVTTFSALELLGPARTWTTSVYADAPIQGGVLKGDLYVRGGGDPNFTLEDLWRLLRALRKNGLKEIRGKLVLDRSLFAPTACEPGAFDDSPFKPHNTCPDALLLNFNAVRFNFLPTPDSKKIAVYADPQPLGLQAVSRLHPAAGSCDAMRDGMVWDAAEWAHGNSLRAPLDRRFFLKGDYPLACGERSLYVPVLSAPLYFYGVWEQLWREAGGRLQGGWREGSVPSDARLLAAHVSPPLASIVRDINKFSNNVMARQLLLLLSARDGVAPASVEASRRLVAEWAQARGLSLPGLSIDNGSGLSRGARITPAGLGQLLVAAFRSPVMPELMASFPVLGVDGTLRRQSKGSLLDGRAHIKTGTLRDVRAMAGYVLTTSGKRYAVVMLVNHEQADAARAALDELLAWVVREG